MSPTILAPAVAAVLLLASASPASAASFSWTDSVVLERVDVRELAFGRSGGCQQGQFCMNETGSIDVARLPSVVRELHLETLSLWNASGQAYSRTSVCGESACFPPTAATFTSSAAGLAGPATHMPEPTTAILLLSGLAGLGLKRRRETARR